MKMEVWSFPLLISLMSLLIADPCDSNPCKNDGQCELGNTCMSYVCRCTGGWSDPSCSTPREYLKSSLTQSLCLTFLPCFEHRCWWIALVIVYSDLLLFCICMLTANPCDTFPCRNGGQCSRATSDDGYVCSCLNGFKGTNCDQPRKTFILL